MYNAIEIETATSVSPEVMEAVARLLPQLSPSAEIPRPGQLQQVIASDCTTLLLARDRAHGGQIVGMVTLAVYAAPTGVRAWIEDVVVDNSARGHGVGEALTREAIRVAHSRGAHTVDLTSRPSRETAGRLYRRIGFQLRETHVFRYAPDTWSTG